MKLLFNSLEKIAFQTFNAFRDTSSSRIDRYNRLNSLSSIKRTEKIISDYFNSISSEKNRTNEKIKFNGVEFDYNEKQTIEILGLPRFKIAQSGVLSDHKILFYKYNIEPYKLKVQLHFFNDRFFFGSHTFDIAKVHEMKKIKLGLIEKYFGEVALANQNSIIDNSNNLILISNSYPVVINYISGNRHLLNSIELDLQLKKSSVDSNLKVSTDFLKVKEML